MQLDIFGLASNKTYKLIKINDEDLEKNLLDFLQNNNIPIASSCSGVQVCKLCITSENVLTCSISVEQYLQKHGNTLSITYL